MTARREAEMAEAAVAILQLRAELAAATEELTRLVGCSPAAFEWTSFPDGVRVSRKWRKAYTVPTYRVRAGFVLSVSKFPKTISRA